MNAISDHITHVLRMLVCAVIITGGVSRLPATEAAGDQPQDGDRQEVLLVVGAGGEQKFADAFDQWRKVWKQAAESGGARLTDVRKRDSQTQKEVLATRLDQLSVESVEPIWIVLIGHGTFDGQSAKFNLAGPDVTADELNKWLERFKRPVIVLNCASSSAPFLAKLAGPNRAVVTATRSGYELNYARFGQWLAAAMIDSSADVDKDGQTSLLEAYIQASKRTAEYYSQQGLLATEHPLLDDTGDGRGTPGDWFRGVRPKLRPKDNNAQIDGTLAHRFHLVRSEQEKRWTAEQRQQRTEMEAQLEKLRSTGLSEDEFLKQAEPILMSLAQLYEQVDQPTDEKSGQ